MPRDKLLTDRTTIAINKNTRERLYNLFHLRERYKSEYGMSQRWETMDDLVNWLLDKIDIKKFEEMSESSKEQLIENEKELRGMKNVG